MESPNIFRNIILIGLTFLIISAFYAHLATAARKTINHQKETAVDYIGNPFGDEYGKSILPEDTPRAKVKRQQKASNDITTNSPSSTETGTVPTLTVTTDLSPSNTTSMDEEENETLTSPSGSPSPPVATSTSTAATTSSTTTETTTPSTTTTTEEPPQFIPPGEGESAKEYFCLCDYQVKVCDMNCCCDPDCSKIQKSVFKHCDDNSIIYDPSYQRNEDYTCLKSYIMYQENIPYRVDRSDKSLFCIVKENVRQAREFSRSDMKRISRRISHGKIDIRPKYTWNSLYEETNITSFNYDEPYKYGSAIWAMRTEIENGEEIVGQEIMFRLPVPFHTETCSILEPVKYLQDSKSRCVRHLYDVSSQCETQQELNANHFIKNLGIITNPIKMQGNTTDFVREQVTPVSWCFQTMSKCTEFSLESASLNFEVSSGEDFEFPTPKLEGFFTTQECKNVLSQLNLTFIHEGILGITKILAKALLIDVPVDSKQIIQEFRTEFIWSTAGSNKGTIDGTRNETNTTSMEDFLHLMKLPRSGNPGYIVGKPLILGRKVTKFVPVTNDTDGKSKSVEKMHVLPDSSQWLHIQGAGDCPLDFHELRDHARNPILFGYDHVSTCNLPLDRFHSCGELQSHIAAIIFGLTGETNPKNFTAAPLYVAAYGSPDAFPSDWIPLTFVDISSLTEESPQFPSSLLFFPVSNTISNGCGGITASVHITVSYAYVGPVDAPQAKVTGVFYEPEEPISIPDSSQENRVKDIPVTTTVSFLDVTGKPTTRVATFPVVSVQLPADFFYPFSSSTTGPSSGAKKTASNEYFSLTSSLAFILLVCGVFVL